MACTIAVAVRGQQRSLARIFQVLSVAMARSPRADLRVGSVHGLPPAGQLRSEAASLERGAHAAAGILVAVVSEVVTSALVSASMML